MDKTLLGQRVAQAREAAGMTQEGLGRAVDLDRTAITRLERGDRRLSVPELLAIARALKRPLSHFVADPLPAVVNRRRDAASAHDTTLSLDSELGQLAADVKLLMDMTLIAPVERPTNARVPRNHQAAERMAARFRGDLGLGAGPLDDLGRASERLGLFVFSASLGEGGPDGGCVEVGEAPPSVGVAVLNGDAPPGRRRMTLAHELGHWLTGDAYDHEASAASEKMLSSFAIHFLAPRAGITATWEEQPDWPIRDRALTVGATFGLSWSATIGQLRNVGLIEVGAYSRLLDDEPRSGDYLRLGLSWRVELSPPYVSPQLIAGCLNGYVSGRLTPGKTLEILRGNLSYEDLPQLPDLTHDDLKRSFAGHDD